MKNLYLLLLLLPSLAFATNFPGNGASGFGGAIGGSTLNITNDATTVYFQLTTASAFSGNALVIYVDNLTGGGFTNTSTFVDKTDGGREAISGYSNPNRTLIMFPAGFVPQKAITVEPGVFSGLFNLSSAATFPFVASGGLAGAGTSFTFSFNKTDLGVTGAGDFKFFATLISTSAYRSNEAIGSILTDTSPAGDAPNYGFTGTIRPATYDTYTSTVLAVSLAQFSGVKQGANTLLQWRTAGEEGVNYFAVQQSVDGTNWYDISTTIAMNSSNGSAYSSTVLNKPAPVNYYRLKTVNRDGSASYSRIITIKTTGLGNIDIINTLAQNEVRFVVNSSVNANIKVYIYTTDGRTVMSKDYRSAGESTLYSLPTDRLQTGMYILRIIAGDESASFKFLKQ